MGKKKTLKQRAQRTKREAECIIRDTFTSLLLLLALLGIAAMQSCSPSISDDMPAHRFGEERSTGQCICYGCNKTCDSHE